MTISRRDFIKTMAVKGAAVTVTTALPGAAFAKFKPSDLADDAISWHKVPCEFCDTGCSLLVGVSGQSTFTVKSDPNCSVSKGAACIKGLHFNQLLYGCGSPQGLSEY